MRQFIEVQEVEYNTNNNDENWAAISGEYFYRKREINPLGKRIIALEDIRSVYQKRVSVGYAKWPKDLVNTEQGMKERDRVLKEAFKSINITGVTFNYGSEDTILCSEEDYEKLKGSLVPE